MNNREEEGEKSSEKVSKPFTENDYDRLDLKHVPGNQPDAGLQSLQERLEQYKKDPAGTPWESAFERLIDRTDKNGSGVC